MSNKRNKAKYPNLNPRLNPRPRQEFIDFDYLDKLNDDELEWLNKFVGEELNASFLNDGTDFNQTKEERKVIYDSNNHRNIDTYSLNRAGSSVLSKEEVNEGKTTLNLWEGRYGVTNDLNENYIDYIENKQITAMMREYILFMRNFKGVE